MPSKSIEALIRKVVAAAMAAPLIGACAPPPRDSCSDYEPYPYKIGLPYIVQLDAGVLALDGGHCGVFCGNGNASCTRITTDAGDPAVSCQNHCVGRPPTGLVLEPSRASCDVGAQLAQMAALEAASVTSFLRLARELSAHRAPASLVAAATRSAADERRHARSIRRLALAHGSARIRFAPISRSIRPLAQVALENAVSGCVLETYGAVEGAWQATHAADPSVRRAMRRIAPDEARHAALAWRVDAWAQRRLSRAVRRQLDQAKREALAGLTRSSSPPAVAARLGLPNPAARSLLLSALAHALRVPWPHAFVELDG